jgi:predicted ATP-dependent endonuclease of OLD family
LLLDAGRHVTKSVVSSWNQIFHKSISEKKVRIEWGTDPVESPNPEEPIPDKVWIHFSIEDSDGFFAIGERSLGFRWFFVYLMITKYRGSRKGSSKDMLFLFDEPASNLHPTAQRALLASLRDISRKAVIIYTTHSHHLVDPTWLGTTFVVTNKGLDAADVSADFNATRTDIQVMPYREFAGKHPEQSRFFQPILDVLEYTPSNLELVPDAIMVEGKSDFYLLSYYEQVCSDLPENERLSLMPGGGAGTLDSPIQLYLGWSRPFVALLDSDEEGKKQVERYTTKFGRIIEGNMITLAQASEKAAASGIESLLEDDDKLKFQRIIDPSAAAYNKKTLLLGVQEALIARNDVGLSASSLKALATTTQSLRERLQAVKKPPAK